MATFYTDWSERDYTVIRFRCVVTESNIDQNANTSKVNWTVYTETDPSGGYRSLKAGSCYVTIDGTTTYLISNSNTKWYNGDQVGSGSKTIPHNNDGTKSINMSMGLTTNYNNTYYGSSTMTLSTIPRQHTVTVSPKLVESTSTPLNITVNNGGNSFTHTVEWRVTKGTTGWVTLATKVTTTSFSVPYNTIKARAGSYTAADIEVRVTTYNGTTQIGTVQTAKTQYLNMTKRPLSLYDDLQGNIGATVGNEADGAGFNVWLDTKFRLPGNSALSETLNDYVFEQGTSGVWTYRKWASGMAECWGTTTINIGSGTWTWWNNIMETDDSWSGGIVYYPSNFFTAEPFYTLNITSSWSIWWTTYLSAGGSNKDHTGAIKCYRGGSASGTVPIYAKVHAIGRWK